MTSRDRSIPVAAAAACATSHAPTAASIAAASAPVSTRYRVVFDGKIASPVGYSPANSPAGTSATHQAIAVNERIPASFAAAHSVSTTATG